MKTYYEKYKDRVEFVGIACKDNDVSWRSAIRQYQLPWIQLLNDAGKQDLSLLYNVLAYPTKILINKQGELTGLYRGETAAFYEELDKLLTK